MAIPPDFHFSQGSLQAYADCPRRFHLRYVQRLDWPAIEAEPVSEREEQLRQGNAFHRLVQQHIVGVPVDRVAIAARDADLRRWWHNYLEHGLDWLPDRRRAEVTLSSPLAGFRLLAKYDVVAVETGARAVIADWKTSRRPPRRTYLAARLQTKVYPYLLVRAGHDLNDGQAFSPEQVEMVYWYAEYPDEPERFTYDATRYAEDEAFLIALIEEIAALDDARFLRTTDGKHCRYCQYRSLCDRGIAAGPIDELDVDEGRVEKGFDFDFEQVAEVDF